MRGTWLSSFLARPDPVDPSSKAGQCSTRSRPGWQSCRRKTRRPGTNSWPSSPTAGPSRPTPPLALWYRGLPDAEADHLLAELADRALLSARAAGWYVAHDLQYDVLRADLVTDGPCRGARTAAGRLSHPLSARLGRVRGVTLTWPRNLAGHLHDAHLRGELRAVLIDTARSRAASPSGLYMSLFLTTVTSSIRLLGRSCGPCACPRRLSPLSRPRSGLFSLVACRSS